MFLSRLETITEFGIATAVALQFFGSKAAVPAALYGIIMLITAPIIARMLKNYKNSYKQ